jgi:hypothetical protein
VDHAEDGVHSQDIAAEGKEAAVKPVLVPLLRFTMCIFTLYANLGFQGSVAMSCQSMEGPYE